MTTCPLRRGVFPANSSAIKRTESGIIKTKMSTREKSFLMRSDPYHTPGYCGYVPQFKYKVGKTFGCHTNELLTSTDPEVASSGQLVLSSIDADRGKSSEDLFSRPIYHGRSRSWGDYKYVPEMVPGYTGYIPKNQHYYATRYAETCHNAFTSFEIDQNKHQEKMEELRTATLGNNVVSLKPIAPKAKPFYANMDGTQFAVASYFTQDGKPRRYFVSGYTGFIPRARKRLGQGYPIIASQSFEERNFDTERRRRTLSEPITLHQPEEKVSALVGIYPRETGLIPLYTGHVPGQKFKYGQTFGVGTRNAFPINESQ